MNLQMWSAVLRRGIPVVLGLLLIPLEVGCQQSAMPSGTAFGQAAERCRRAVNAGQYQQAGQDCQKAVAMATALFGQDNETTVVMLSYLATAYQEQGLYAQAEPLATRVLTVRERALGTQHPEIVESLASLASLHVAQAHYAQAEPLLLRALAIREKAVGSEHPDVAESKDSLASLRMAEGHYAQAEPLYERALEIREKALGAQHPDVARSLNNLALLYQEQGLLAQAEPLFKRALIIKEKLLGEQHLTVAVGLGNLASLYADQGQSAQAEPLFKRALAIKENALGRQHPDVAVSLHNLATMYTHQEQYSQAEPLFQRALKIREAALGLQHPDVALTLNNLATLYRNQGRYAQAEPLFQRALAIQEMALGLQHPDVATCLSDLAILYEDQGQYAQAEPLFLRALAIQEKALGEQHPDIALSLYNLARLDLKQGQLLRALPLLLRSLQIRESLLRQTVSEPRVAALLDDLRYQEDLVYTLLLEQPGEPAVRPLALTLSLLRKGRSVDAGAQANRALIDSLDSREQRDRFLRWQQLREQREQFIFAGAGKPQRLQHQQQLAALKLQIEALEEDLVDASAVLRTFTLPKWDDMVQSVARKLPAHSALVEVVLMQPYSFRAMGNQERWGNSRYVAMVLFPDGRTAAADLGEAAAVERAVAELMLRLQNPSTDPLASAQALYRLIFFPLVTKLRGASQLYLSLDGALNLVSWAALHDGKQYLLDRYHLHYLTSGRDLLREPIEQVRQPPMVFADPDYSASATTSAGPIARSLDGGTRGLYNRLRKLPRLPGTRKESQLLSSLLPTIQVRTGQEATEQALRQARSPQLLHIATHGVFLQDEHPEPLPAHKPRSGVPSHALAPREMPSQEESALWVLGQGGDNPLSRSALVLAGAAQAAQSPTADQDGLLTAEEARSLDLWGTELVVLSACETGRGAISTGQGVYGLRRAFIIAGAETLVASLWQVADLETGELMKIYYEKLIKQGRPRVGAMQEAMKEMRQKKPHPYYWAPFLVLGRDAPLGAHAVPVRMPAR